MEKLDKTTLEGLAGNFPLKVLGEVDMQGEDDLVIIVPKDSGKYFIQIHPLE